MWYIVEKSGNIKQGLREMADFIVTLNVRRTQFVAADSMTN